MALSQRLELRQGQGLVLTPQLQQAIKLLQLSNLELEEFVETELERNPLLTRDEREGDREALRADAPAPAPEMAAADQMGAREAQSDLDAPADDVFADASPDDLASGENSEAAAWSRVGSGGGGAEPFGSFAPEDRPRGATLAEHVTAQLALAGLVGPRRAIAQVLIDAVDEGGYLRADLSEISERLGAPLAMAEEVLAVLQGFDPTGVFARDVAECLKLQLIERGRFDEPAAALISRLDLLARHDLGALRKVCGVSEGRLGEMIAELRSLTPRPGAAFGGEPAPTLIPDVFVREAPGGAWRVELNTETLPRVLVDRRYHAQISAAARREKETSFVSECLASANWLVKSLDQRARTILKVAGEIVRQQDAFLAYGVEHLRPLNLKTVADAIGMHESTVSRATSNKYMATPRGVFEMKFFFTFAIPATGGGEAHSAESVRHKIRQLIDGEGAADQVHSDDAIVDILKEAGVDIARRTVAKYRDAMRIPSSVERKRRLAM
ncbi:MAG TPA: RNA polymerase factor sigma-54 [Caulobacteraceae bacterium]|nr:RNA polymerase factor sigma-54 [Caulobacteraceae bacterium]